MKRLLVLFFLVPLGIWAQNPIVTCAGGINAVQVGHSITCTSNVAVTWTLAGVGTLTGLTGTSATYNAPASITPQHVMGGWQVTPDDSIFHTRIDNLPVNPSSAALVAQMTLGNPTGIWVNFGEMSWGTSTCDASTPRVNLANFYGGGTSGFPIATGPRSKVESGSYRSRMDNNDHHVMELCTDSGEFFDAYGIHNSTSPSGIECNGGSLGYCNAQASISYSWHDYVTNSGISGVDAAGLPLAPLTLTAADLYSGVVKHALRFTTVNAGVSNGSTCSAINSCNQSGAANQTLAGTQYMLYSIYGSGGNSPLATTESTVQQTSVNRRLGSFDVSVGTAPPAGQTLTVNLRDNGVTVSPACVITGPSNGCSVGTSYTIPDGHAIDYQLVSSSSFTTPWIFIQTMYAESQLWPAGSSNGDLGYTAPVMGTRVRLRLCGIGGVTTNCATLSSYTPYQQIVLTGLNQYGMILADNGSYMSVTPSSDISLDRDMLNQIAGLGFPSTYLDVVDESMLQLNNSYVTCPYNINGICAGGTTNTYEQPANQAMLVAANSQGTTYTPIAIQAVTIRVGTW